MPVDRPLAPDDSLPELGLDSMGTVSVLVELEQAFSVTFSDELLVPDTFATPGNLWSALSGLPARAR
jgi:acyl carrier protein